jgi:TPR repeat protein
VLEVEEKYHIRGSARAWQFPCSQCQRPKKLEVQTTSESHLWLQRAVDNFDVDAQADLGEALLRGMLGYSKNSGLGMHYLLLAGRQGDHRAQSLVGRQLLGSEGGTSAWSWLLDDEDVSRGSNNDGTSGAAAVDNLREAVRWLRLAACENPCPVETGRQPSSLSLCPP